jgi:hypothetical protein
MRDMHLLSNWAEQGGSQVLSNESREVIALSRRLHLQQHASNVLYRTIEVHEALCRS